MKRIASGLVTALESPLLLLFLIPAVLPEAIGLLVAWRLPRYGGFHHLGFLGYTVWGLLFVLLLLFVDLPLSLLAAVLISPFTHSERAVYRLADILEFPVILGMFCIILVTWQAAVVATLVTWACLELISFLLPDDSSASEGDLE